MAYASSPALPPVPRVQIQPVDCFKQSWAAIKEQYWLMLGVCFVGMMVGGTVPVVIFGPMFCGIYLCLLQRLAGQRVEFATLFKGFDFFKESLLATLIMVGFSLLFMLPVLVVYLAVFFIGIPMMVAGDKPEFSCLIISIFFLVYLVFIVTIAR